MAKTKKKSKPKPKAKGKKCRHGDDPRKCISCEMLSKRPDKKEPPPPKETSKTLAVQLPEPKPKADPPKKAPAPVVLVAVYHAHEDRAERYIEGLKKRGVEAKIGKSRYPGYVTIEVDAKVASVARRAMGM